VEELAEEAAADAAAREEMVKDHRRWDEDMAAARRAREIHELASERRHRRNLAVPAVPPDQQRELEHRRCRLERRLM
jgi:hypothetical protein